MYTCRLYGELTLLVHRKERESVKVDGTVVGTLQKWLAISAVPPVALSAVSGGDKSEWLRKPRSHSPGRAGRGGRCDSIMKLQRRITARQTAMVWQRGLFTLQG